MDSTLRTQERLARTGDSAALIRFANDIGRVAGRDAALATLIEGRDELEVRREFEHFAAWSQLDADAGATRWLDTAPLCTSPRLRWQSKPLLRTGGRHAAGPWRFVAGTPAAILVGRRGELVALDPESGSTLWAKDQLTIAGVDRFEQSFVDRGALVRCRWNCATWHDLRTGQVVAEERFDGGCLLGFSTDGVARFITLSHPRRPRVLRLLESSGSRPGLTATWELHGAAIPLEPAQALLASGLLVLIGRGSDVGVLALELSTGSLRWSRSAHARAGMLDAHGLILRGDDLACVGPDGGLRWTQRLWGASPALTPETVVCALPYGVIWLDRVSGTTIRTVPMLRAGRVAAARDAVFTWEGGKLAALTTRGDPIWSRTLVELPPIGLVRDVLPLRGRLLLIRDDWPESHVICLEGSEPTSRGRRAD